MTIKGIANLSVAELQSVLALFQVELTEAHTDENMERIQQCEVNIQEVNQEITKRIKGN